MTINPVLYEKKVTVEDIHDDMRRDRTTIDAIAIEGPDLSLIHKLAIQANENSRTLYNNQIYLPESEDFIDTREIDVSQHNDSFDFNQIDLVRFNL